MVFFMGHSAGLPVKSRQAAFGRQKSTIPDQFLALQATHTLQAPDRVKFGSPVAMSEASVKTRLAAVKSQVQEIEDIGSAMAQASWTEQTAPIGEAAAIPLQEMNATFTKMRHGKMTDPSFVAALRELSKPAAMATLTIGEQALVRVVSEDVEKALKLPAEFVGRQADVAKVGFSTWEKAKKANRFADFAPVLTQLVDLAREKAGYLGYDKVKGSPYDALMNEYEPGLTVRQMDQVFEPLKRELPILVKAIQRAQTSQSPGDLALRQAINGKQGVLSKRMKLSQWVLGKMGFDFQRGILGASPHPFTTSFGSPNLVPLTIGRNEGIISSILSGMHEGGHGNYAQGTPAWMLRTSLASSPSLGMDESQSRLWENVMGRSREVWTTLLPQLKREFPKQFGNVTLDSLLKAVNTVEPGVVRLLADEVTYNLHILVRYEIERDLIEGKLEVADVPKAWAGKIKSYLGQEPKGDADGALQDVHWSDGSFGYFPTYTLGNLASVQFFNQMKREIPGVSDTIRRGQWSVVNDWMREKIYSVGRIEKPDQILRRVTGESLNPTYFIDYLWDKYIDLYGITRP